MQSAILGGVFALTKKAITPFLTWKTVLYLIKVYGFS